MQINVSASISCDTKQNFVPVLNVTRVITLSVHASSAVKQVGFTGLEIVKHSCLEPFLKDDVLRDVYGADMDAVNLEDLISDTESDIDSDIYFDTESESFSKSENEPLLEFIQGTMDQLIQDLLESVLDVRRISMR
ncbi:hypothetical protein TNCV_3849971 [Trichonephila clavipes]|nr:hypothetical protein TNCV_3849971 [Trichonephila clavipes]